MKKIEFEDFEKVVMSKLLDGDDPVLEVLRNQYNNAQIYERDFTDIGFFTYYIVPDNVTKLKDLHEIEIADVSGIVNATFVTFILYVRNGAISVLNGVSDTDSWPKEIYNYHLNYRKSRNSVSTGRDMEMFRAMLERHKNSLPI